MENMNKFHSACVFCLRNVRINKGLGFSVINNTWE